MNLPEKFVEEGLKLAEGASFMGHKFSELTHDELIAVAVHGWKAEQQTREQGSRERKFLFDLMRHK